MGFETAKDWRNSWGGELARWRDRPATRKAWKLFDALEGTEKDRYLTINRIVQACHGAMHFRPKDDPGLRYREEMARQRRELHKLATAARVLRRACERNDAAMMWLLPGGTNQMGVTLSRPPSLERAPVCEMGAAWFGELDKRLREPLPQLHGGPFLHRFTIGNLHFERALEQPGRPPSLETMLAFDLTFRLRKFTAGRAGDITSFAQKMPRDGRPCFDVVAAFCNATLGTNLSGVQIADRLRRLPADVGLMPWEGLEPYLDAEESGKKTGNLSALRTR